MAFGDENTIDTASAISGFADTLDQAADEISSPREGGSPNVTAGDTVSLGGGAGFDPSAGVPGGPESQPFSGDTGVGPSEVEGTIDQEVDVTNLGDKPSLQALQSAIDSSGSPREGDSGIGGDPSDMIAGLMGEEEVAEEVAPGQQVADFLSDFNQGMSGVGHPDWGMSGSAVPMSAEQAVANINSGGQGGGEGWVNPNDEMNSISLSDAMRQDREEALSSTNPDMFNSTVNPTLEELEAQFSTSPHRMTAEQAALSASGGLIRGSDIRRQEELGITPSGGQGWVDPNTPQPVTDFITDVSMDPQYQPQRDLRELISLEENEATALAPQYSEKSPGYQTHNEMYPNHRNVAAMAGVASIKSMFDGTHKAWIEAINEDMDKREIVLDHAINGVRTGKHSSGNWKEYDALFTVGEDGVPRDSDGVAMPGTEKQAQSGMAGALQGLWGGILSGAEKLFQPSTSSGVEDPYANLGYPDYASGNIPANIRQPATVGDDTRGDNPIDIIRSTYSWAASLPNSVLLNAARHPDYLRLLIEYDATGKDLPLTVPTWILEGTDRPAEDEEETASWISNHPAMQTQELTWTA